MSSSQPLPELAPPLPFLERLEHDPRNAEGLATIQSSKLALAGDELEALHRDGLVLSRRPFASFVEGYVELYGADLPLFISADSILHAIHRSYEDFLASIEATVLGPTLRALLSVLRENLGHAHRRGADPQACADLDLYLAIALHLLAKTRFERFTRPLSFSAGTAPTEGPEVLPDTPWNTTGQWHVGRDGIVSYGTTVTARLERASVVLSPVATIRVLDDQGSALERHILPRGAFLLLEDGARVRAGTPLAEADPSSEGVLADVHGRVVIDTVEDGARVIETYHERTGLAVKQVVAGKDPARGLVLRLLDASGATKQIPETGQLARYELLPGTYLVAEPGKLVRRGYLLASIPHDDVLAPHDEIVRPHGEPAAPVDSAGESADADATVSPVAGCPPALLATWLERIESGQDVEPVELFGATRAMDLSQLRAEEDPWGQTTAPLSGYHEAFRWLNAASFHLVRAEPDGTSVLDARQLAATRLLDELLTDDALAHWERFAGLLRAWVGEFDGLTVRDVGALIRSTGEDPRALTEALVRASRERESIDTEPAVMHGPRPPVARCRLLGSCFAIDALVMHRLVYDRVCEGRAARPMPDPLDVAYSAIGNDHAATLLASELARFPYAPDLAAARTLCDERARASPTSLYDAWLAMLRALSPRREQLAEGSSSLPDTARSEHWARRVLNTQLASWAELRHATRHYAKESRTWGIICEFPDAFVEPCPDFFDAVLRWGGLARETVQWIEPTAPHLATEMRAYVGRLIETAGVLGDMARRQSEGLPLTDDHLRFANQLVTLRPRGMCAPLKADGWFPGLYRDADRGTVPGVPVAAVHTDDCNRRVLHVGTTRPQLMAFTVATPRGPHVYAGLASTFRTLVTEDYERLDDAAWAERYGIAPQPTWFRAAPSPVVDSMPVIGEVHDIESRADGFHILFEPTQRLPSSLELRKLDRDVRDPVTGAVLARRDDDAWRARDQLRERGHHSLPIASWRLLGGWLFGELRDTDGSVIAPNRSRITPAILDHMTRIGGRHKIIR